MAAGAWPRMRGGFSTGGGPGGAEPPRGGGTRACAGGGAQRPLVGGARSAPPPRRYVILPLFFTKSGRKLQNGGQHKMAAVTSGHVMRMTSGLYAALPT